MHKILTAVPIGIVAIYVSIVMYLCAPHPLALGNVLLLYTQTLLPAWFLMGLLALLFATAKSHRTGTALSPLSIATEFFAGHWSEDRCLSVLLPLLCFVPLITAYNLFKEVYLPAAGFWFGSYLASADHLLLGRDGWELTHQVLASPWATQVIDLFYECWFAPLILGVALCSFARPNSIIGWRYLTSYILLWTVQGSFIAYLLPAAGPALRVTVVAGSKRFTPLVARLAEQDRFLRAHGAPGLFSLENQHKLVALFGSQDFGIGGGISAMPSLHNAMTVLFACAAWAIGRRPGVIATVYAFAIWIGSVHLGWHYALDGIVAAALTILTWVGVGRLPALVQRAIVHRTKMLHKSEGDFWQVPSPALSGSASTARQAGGKLP